MSTKYGCCPDHVTEAHTLDLFDCPLNCTYSKYGCCKDGITASRGPGFAACPKINKEINYDELTAASIDCINTEFGCCEDGVTVANSKFKDNCLSVDSSDQAFYDLGDSHLYKQQNVIFILKYYLI